jgi:hypothetical protein
MNGFMVPSGGNEGFKDQFMQYLEVVKGKVADLDLKLKE